MSLYVFPRKVVVVEGPRKAFYHTHQYLLQSYQKKIRGYAKKEFDTDKTLCVCVADLL